MDMNINYFSNEDSIISTLEVFDVRRSEYFDVMQKLPKECFYNIPNGTIQDTKIKCEVEFIREYFHIHDLGRKVIFNYKDNNILKPPNLYDFGLGVNNLFYDERIKIILQFLIEDI